jgi:hypothetical protein
LPIAYPENVALSPSRMAIQFVDPFPVDGHRIPISNGSNEDWLNSSLHKNSDLSLKKKIK